MSSLVTLLLAYSHSPQTEEGSGDCAQALKLMQEFAFGQKWIMADALFGIFIAEVIEVSEDGMSGTVLIEDAQGNEVDTFAGTAAEFQASGEWRLLHD